jgi:hypothetical protein
VFAEHATLSYWYSRDKWRHGLFGVVPTRGAVLYFRLSGAAPSQNHLLTARNRGVDDPSAGMSAPKDFTPTDIHQSGAV